MNENEFERKQKDNNSIDKKGRERDRGKILRR